METVENTGSAGPPTLKRAIGLPLLVLYGLGVTIGAGIYVLIGHTAGRAEMHAPSSFVVAAFVVGMLMTPPDIFSQTLLALPVWLLFEIGLWFSRRIKPGQDLAEAEEG